ncbi:mechanosensitive ion channel family protein [Bacteroidota bacterium]
MNQKKKGFILGGLLLVFFVIFNFRQGFYSTFLQNYQYFSEKMLIWIPKTVSIIIILLTAKLIITILESVMEKYFKYVGREKEYYSVISVTRYITWLLAIIGILSVLIGNLGVWLTSVGLIGFGITFALQRPILNFVGWLTIIITKTYTLGDRIKVGDDRGDVIEIQIMYTVIDGLLDNSDELSGKIVTIPNAQPLTSSVINFTKNGEYIFDEVSVDITYESDWKKAEEMLKVITYNVVNKYVKSTKKEISDKQEQMDETMDILKKHHRESDIKNSDKKVIENKIDELEDEKMRLEGVKQFAFRDIKKEPSVRISLRESSIGMNVRYIAHYTHMRLMQSEINRSFLEKVGKTKNIEVAYPHMQIVGQKKFFGNRRK